MPSGLKLALEESLPGSHIYVFTDASAKDHHLLEEIISLVSDKQPHVSEVEPWRCPAAGVAGVRVCLMVR